MLCRTMLVSSGVIVLGVPKTPSVVIYMGVAF